MFIDMHCDTLLKAVFDGDFYCNPDYMLDIERMVQAGQGAQFFAVFFPPEEEFPDMPEFPPDGEYFESARDILLKTANKYPDKLKMAYNADDIENNMKNGICSAVLTIEDARAVNGDMKNLRYFYEAGVRAMSLTWNGANCFGYPNSKEPELMSLGLTEFGKEAILVMGELGMLVDVSHLSDGGFWDVAELCKKPFIATHSNCRELCGHPRNLSDEMIRTLAGKGGVAGVNFVPDFLKPNADNENSAEDICRHVLHYINTGGEDCIGLGSDFDGFEGTMEIGQPTDLEKLFALLSRKGLSERQLEKFAYGNVLRVVRDVL